MIFILLLIAHYIGDFSHFSMPFMLKAKLTGYPWSPIFLHAMVHALLVGMCIWTMVGLSEAIVACGIVLGTHFGIDVLKGKINVWFPSITSPKSYAHWYVFGADQMLHIIILFIVYNISK